MIGMPAFSDTEDRGSIMEIRLPDGSCTGCGACAAVCQKNAVRMKARQDGFLYPEIDTAKCISCGRCMNACHAGGEKQMVRPEACYAAQVKDPAVLKKSTSGGAFYALASEVLAEGGAVYGCVYDEHYDAGIRRIDSLEGLSAIHGSKYVWSESGQSYGGVLQDLKEGRTVLYSGLPCQVAGLKKYLGRPYDGLYTVDLLCGGAPSPYAFHRYLETLADEAGLQSLDFQFRDKDPRGAGVNCTYRAGGKKHCENYLENSFYFAFSSRSRITWRLSCYHCDYKSLLRVSDMTIGDYWGVEKYHSDFDPKKGVSVILVNTPRGRQLFEKASEKLRFQDSQASYAIEKNSLVETQAQGYVDVPADRTAFFETLRKDGWASADRRFLGLRKKMLRAQKKQRIVKKLRQLLKH